MKPVHIAILAIAVVLIALLVAYYPFAPRETAAPAPGAAAPSVPVAPEPGPAEPAPVYPAAIAGAVAGEWTMDLDAAKALAAEKGLPLLLNFTGSDWCGWCRRMEKQVFSQAAWQTYAREHFVLVWIDFPRNKQLVPEAFVARNARLMQEYEVGGFPTYVLLDADGQTRLGTAGAARDATPESFIATLAEVLLTADQSVAALRDKLSDEQKAALDVAKESRDLAHRKLDEWIATNPEPTDENNALFEAMQDEIRRADAAFLELLRAAQ